MEKDIMIMYPSCPKRAFTFITYLDRVSAVVEELHVFDRVHSLYL